MKKVSSPSGQRRVQINCTIDPVYKEVWKNLGFCSISQILEWAIESQCYQGFNKGPLELIKILKKVEENTEDNKETKE